MGNRIEELGCATVVIAIIVLFILNCMFAVAIMLLWNWLAPVFWVDAPILTFWQTLGTMILLSFLVTFFKGLFKD